jgi:hypothetical protein
MKATAPLLRFAAERAREMKPQPELFVRWAELHAEEEAEHYQWFLNDMVQSGQSANEMLDHPPRPELSLVVGTQFLLAATTHPASILGYFFAMECRPNDATEIESLADRLSLPTASIRTLLFHTHADQEHKREIIDVISRYCQNPVIWRGIVHSAIESINGWTYLFNALAREMSNGCSQ